MFLFQFEENRVDVASRVAHRYVWWNPNVKEQVGLFRRAARAPRMSTANSSEIHDRLLAAIGRFLFPGGSPLQDSFHQFVHAANGVHLLTAFAECGVNINSGAGDAHPHRTEMLEHHVHVRWLAEN